MKILSINIKGGGEPEKFKEILSFLNDNKIDIAFLCESHITEDRTDKYRERWRNYGWFSNCPSPNKCGVTFVILRPDRIPIDSCKVIKKDSHGRKLGIQIMAEGGTDPIKILGIYAPNRETSSVDFFTRSHEDETGPQFDIMLGDFNRCQEQHDRNPTRSEDKRVRNALTLGTQCGRLIDGWRITNPDKRQYTYWSNNDLRSASRLDRIYVTQPVFQKCLKWDIIPTPAWTDHHAVSVEYCPGDKVETGEGQWYMNVRLLQHQKMKEALSNVLQIELGKIAALLEDPDLEGNRVPQPDKAQNVISQFDHLLEQIRYQAKMIQEQLAKQKSKVMRNLNKKIERLNVPERTHKESKQLKKLEIRRQALLKVITEHKPLLSKAKWLEMGTHRHADFWKLGNNPVGDRTIQGLQNTEGKVQKRTSEILGIARGYYDSLYYERRVDKPSQEHLLANIP